MTVEQRRIAYSDWRQAYRADVSRRFDKKKRDLISLRQAPELGLYYFTPKGEEDRKAD